MTPRIPSPIAFAAPLCGADMPHLHGRWPSRPKQVDVLLDALARLVPMQTRELHTGEVLHVAGEPFEHLLLPAQGCFKTVSRQDDGYLQIVGLHLRGDWLGLEAMLSGRHALDAIALEPSLVRSVEYGALLGACAQHAALLAMVSDSMREALECQRDTLMALTPLLAEPRLAMFIDRWRLTLAGRGISGSLIPMPLSPADIANFLGLPRESVDEVLSGWLAGGLVRWVGDSGRALEVRDEARWAAYRRGSAAGATGHRFGWPSARSIAWASSSRENGLASSSAAAGSPSSHAVGG